MIKIHKKPFLHAVISDVLSRKDARGVLQELQKEHFEEKESDLFKLKQTKDFAISKSSKNKKFLEFRNFLMAKKTFDEISSNFKVKLKNVSCAGSLYTNTDFLLPHDDRLENRKVAYIYYLSDLGKKDGGALQLLDKKGEVVKSIQPKFNTMVLFLVSKDSIHKVDEVTADKNRYSINGWFF